MTKTHRISATALVLVLMLTVGVRPARADLYGADVPVLLDLLINSFAELDNLRQQIKVARETYEETKALVGYANDAKRAFESYQKYSGEMFGQELLTTLDRSFPDLAYFHNEIQNGGLMAAGENPALRQRVVYCVGQRLEGTECAEVYRALTLEETRDAIHTAFGTAPEGAVGVETRVADQEAAVAIAAGSAQMGRNQIERTNAKDLLSLCTSGTSEENIAACQAAAYTAEIRQLEQGAYLSDQMVEANRLQAIRILQENAKRKRELEEAKQRREAVIDAADTLGAKPVEIHSDGFDFFGNGR